jgi:hypothetical protein
MYSKPPQLLPQQLLVVVEPPPELWARKRLRALLTLTPRSSSSSVNWLNMPFPFSRCLHELVPAAATSAAARGGGGTSAGALREEALSRALDAHSKVEQLVGQLVEHAVSFLTIRR